MKTKVQFSVHTLRHDLIGMPSNEWYLIPTIRLRTMSKNFYEISLYFLNLKISLSIFK